MSRMALRQALLPSFHQVFLESPARLLHDGELFGSALADAGFVAAGPTRADEQAAERFAFTDVAQPAEGVDEAHAVHATR